MDKRLTVATWNVNSIRARREHLLAWLQAVGPDVLCLQELKTTDEDFPFMELETLGYMAATNGQKTYNGVAILSRAEPADVSRGMGDDDPQARLVSCRYSGVTVICAYFPNGSEPESEKYTYKKDWLARFMKWIDSGAASRGPTVLCGDFNIAPTPLDVSDDATWEGTVIYNPEMRQAFADIEARGFIDVFRHLNPGVREFSWWDYRMNAFRRNLGLRLDYVMATRELATAAVSARVDRAERAREKPSDHAPVIVEFTIP